MLTRKTTKNMQKTSTKNENTCTTRGAHSYANMNIEQDPQYDMQRSMIDFFLLPFINANFLDHGIFITW